MSISRRGSLATLVNGCAVNQATLTIYRQLAKSQAFEVKKI